MMKYIGPDYVPGVACQDYTDEQWKALIDSGQIVEGSPAAANWEKKSAGKAKSGGAGGESTSGGEA